LGRMEYFFLNKIPKFLPQNKRTLHEKLWVPAPQTGGGEEEGLRPVQDRWIAL
jgi:hypothetical protein